MFKKNYLTILFLVTFSFCLYAQSGKIKVSSLNVRNDNTSDVAAGNSWQNRYPVIANMILFYDMDIIGTQECKSNQIHDLMNVLGNYKYNYIGRGRGVEPTEDEYSAIFYRTDRFQMLSSGNFWLSETPDIPSVGWDAVLNRICTWGKFKERSTGFKFFAFNLHMDHVGVNARRYSSELVLEKIKQIAIGAPVFLTGDFNTDQFGDGYKIITSSGLLSDSYQKASIVHDFNGTFNGFAISNTTNQRIDHVFISNQFTALRYGILTDLYWSDKTDSRVYPKDFPAETTVTSATPRLPSDHFPVLVELKYYKKKVNRKTQGY